MHFLFFFASITESIIYLFILFSAYQTARFIHIFYFLYSYFTFSRLLYYRIVSYILQATAAVLHIRVTLPSITELETEQLVFFTESVKRENNGYV